MKLLAWVLLGLVGVLHLLLLLLSHTGWELCTRMTKVLWLWVGGILPHRWYSIPPSSGYLLPGWLHATYGGFL